jgi:hypothetical protein
VATVVALFAGVAQSVTVINKTTGELLFYDDFETALAVSTGAYPDESGDYDPDNTATGTWTINETGPTNIQVASYLGNGLDDPAAVPQGTNYLRFVRHTAAAFEAGVVLPAVQNTPGDVIHTEAMVWIPLAVNANAFQIQLLGSGGSTDFRANILLVQATSGIGGPVNAWDAVRATPAYAATGLEWRGNTWQKWEVDYAVGSDTFEMAIDGAKRTLPRSGAAGDVRRVFFRCGASGANMQFRLDATGWDGTKQDSFTLFQDGFENGTPDSTPGTIVPDIGTYRDVGSGAIVRTGDLSAGGGPAAANSGANYLELTRLSNRGASLSCMFAGGPIEPDTQELRTRFMLWWGGAGLPGHGIGRATTGYFYPTNFLTYNLIRPDASYDAYDGSAYVKVAPSGTVPLNTWVPVEVTWDPATQLSMLRVNGGNAVTNALFGAVPEILDRLFLSSGINTTVYWVDDVEAEWVYTPPPPPPPPPSGSVFSLR